MDFSFGILVVSSLIFISVSGLQVYIPFPTKEVGLGRAVIVPCRARGVYVGLSLRWLGPSGHQLSMSARMQTELSPSGDSLSLRLFGATHADSGVYRCVATDAGSGERAEGQVMITVSQSLEFVSVPAIQEFVLGSTAVVTCQVKGHADLRVTWARRGHPVTYDRRVHKAEDHSLVIREVGLADQGAYRCEAQVESRGELDYRDITLSVTVPPRVSLSPHEVNVTASQSNNVSLHCRILSGSPSPTLSWLRDEDELSPSSPRVSVSHGGSRLQLSSAERADAGFYSCRANNRAGNHTDTTLVRVFEMPEVLWAVGAEGMPGDGATLSCGAYGDPPPTVTWRKLGEHREWPSSHQTDPVDGRVNSTLRFHKLAWTHEGEYLCIATNALNFTSHSLNLTVLFAPLALAYPEAPFYTWPGNDVNLTCEFRGFPTPRVSWSRYGRDRIRSSAALHAVSPSYVASLLLVDSPNQRDYGNYTCSASNSFGSASRRVELLQAEPPSPPSLLNPVDIDQRSVHLSFVAGQWDGGAPVTATVSQHRPIGCQGRGSNTNWTSDEETERLHGDTDEEVDGWKTGTYNSSATLIIIQGLESNCSYELRVASVNGAGRGRFSLPVIATTLPVHVVPTPPRFSLSPGDPEFIILSVDDDGGTEIQKYRVRLRPVSFVGGGVGVSPLGPWSEVWGGSDGRVWVGGLRSDCEYEATAFASNARGESAPLRFSFRTTDTRTRARTSNVLVWLMIPSCLLLLAMLVDVACCISRRKGFTASLARALGHRGDTRGDNETRSPSSPFGVDSVLPRDGNMPVPEPSTDMELEAEPEHEEEESQPGASPSFKSFQ